MWNENWNGAIANSFLKKFYESEAILRLKRDETDLRKYYTEIFISKSL